MENLKVREPQALDLEQGWNYVSRSGINKVINLVEGHPDEQKFTPEEYMKLYTTVYNMCSTKPPYGHSKELYARYREAFYGYINTMVLPAIDGKQSESMLMELVRRWENHKVMVYWLTRFFNFLERYYIRKQSLPSLCDVANSCFRHLVYQKVKHNVVETVVLLIDRERDGEQVDQALLKGVLGIFVEMGMGCIEVYRNDFEVFMLKDTAHYYETKVSSDIEVEACLKQEKERVEHYLHPSSGPKLMESSSSLEKNRIKVLTKFADCFTDELPDEFPPSRPEDHTIDLILGSSPNQPPYRVSLMEQEEILKEVNELLEKGLIRPKTSPYCSPVLLVQQKDGTFRHDGVDGHSSGSEHSLDEELGIPAVRTLGVRRLHAKIGLLAVMQSLVAHDVEPTFFEETDEHVKWQEARNEGMDALYGDEMWELMPLPKGNGILDASCLKARSIFDVDGVQHNNDGSVSGYKARLVAKGYAHTYGIDYEETFSTIAKMATVRAVIVLSATKGWILHEMDVKNAFLHGDLQEELDMEQPPYFQDTGHPDYVCKSKVNFDLGTNGAETSGKIAKTQLLYLKYQFENELDAKIYRDEMERYCVKIEERLSELRDLVPVVYSGDRYFDDLGFMYLVVHNPSIVDKWGMIGTKEKVDVEPEETPLALNKTNLKLRRINDMTRVNTDNTFLGLYKYDGGDHTIFYRCEESLLNELTDFMCSLM
ncbi:hypothetical protein L7F22_014482 [Adiantum nelumboides]|nr:hypothetical protein [Adiantum nelumboides]